MPYWRLHYHLIWATYQRLPLLNADREMVVHATLRNKASEMNLWVHAIGNIEDHIHMVVSIPPKISVAECLRQLKGASSFAANHQLEADLPFKWQEGYGVLSLGERSLPTVVEYVQNQKHRHQNQLLIPIYERLEAENPENGENKN
ncbi:MAG: IS200/IS605 family transposase [Chloroflexi bacterium]|nr:IS200/IS605 family transposase [Chloroflexota bacterium]